MVEWTRCRTIWGWGFVGLVWACAHPTGGSTASTPDPEPYRLDKGQTVPPKDKDSPPVISTGTAQEVFCLAAPKDPIPACIDSRTAEVALPLTRATYIGMRPGLIEVGGLAPSAREPGRADRSDAAFVRVEQGRVTKVVRDHEGGKRGAFLAQAARYRLRSSEGILSLWRDDGAVRDLGVKLDLAAAGGESVRLHALGGDSAENLIVAYQGLAVDEQRKSAAPFIGSASVRVTSGPPAEWSVSSWASLPDATSPALVVTGRGAALAAFELSRDGKEPALVIQSRPGADGAKVERFPFAALGGVSSLGDVVFALDRWIVAAAFTSEAVVGATPRETQETQSPTCAKPPSLPPAREPRFDEAAWQGSTPGQGGIAVVTHGPKLSQSLILEMGSSVTPGHLAELDSSHTVLSFCTRQPAGCYLAVVSLDGRDSVLCSTASSSTPALVAVDGPSVVWVESRPRAVELNTARSLNGLPLKRVPR